jgi:predicted HTH transcriptional regulator
MEEDEMVVLKVLIPESKNKPHLAQVKENDWRAFIRVKDESLQTNTFVLQALKKDEPVSQRVHLNKLEWALLTYLKDQPRITLQQYRQLLNISQRQATHILVNLVLQKIIRQHDQENETYYTLN